MTLTTPGPLGRALDENGYVAADFVVVLGPREGACVDECSYNTLPFDFSLAYIYNLTNISEPVMVLHYISIVCASL